jgi:hypothetical protein
MYCIKRGFSSNSLWQYVLQTLHKLYKYMFQEMETEIKYKDLNSPIYGNG